MCLPVFVSYTIGGPPRSMSRLYRVSPACKGSSGFHIFARSKRGTCFFRLWPLTPASRRPNCIMSSRPTRASSLAKWEFSAIDARITVALFPPSDFGMTWSSFMAASGSVLPEYTQKFRKCGASRTKANSFKLALSPRSGYLQTICASAMIPTTPPTSFCSAAALATSHLPCRSLRRCRSWRSQRGSDHRDGDGLKRFPGLLTLG